MHNVPRHRMSQMMAAISLLIVLIASRSVAGMPPSLGAADHARAGITASVMGHLPLAFEENEGQAPAGVRFLCRGAGYGLLLSPTESVLTLAAPAMGPASRAGGIPARSDRPDAAPVVLRTRFVGARDAVSASGLERLPGTVNVFRGNDPKRWRTHIPTYGRVRFESLYPEVDLVYYGSGRRLEYDLVVRPGAEPSQNRFSVEGARSLRVTAHGDLLAETAAGPVLWKAPVTYQGSGTSRRTVSAGYRLNGRSVSFRLGKYDRSRPLVIDPVLVYSTYLGGSDWDVADGVATDAAGNAIVVGWTWSYDFPVSPGAYSTQILGDLVGFVAKLSADGKMLLWATYLGGLKGSGLYSVARDRDGNLWTTGDTYASDFPTTEDAFDRTYNGFVDRDAVLAKLSANGDALLYSTYIGGGAGRRRIDRAGPPGRGCRRGRRDLLGRLPDHAGGV